MSVKLNLGSGFTSHPDFISVDKLKYEDNLIQDVLKGLLFPDDTFDFVLLNHVLQTFTYNEHEAVLKEVKRVMKPGATLRVLVPDLNKAVEAYIHSDRQYFPIADDIELSTDGKFARYLFWHGETRCAFGEAALENLFIRNRFNKISIGKFGDCELDSRELESLIMVCQK